MQTATKAKLKAVQVQEFGNGEMANTKKQSNETDGDQGNLEEKLIQGSRQDGQQKLGPPPPPPHPVPLYMNQLKALRADLVKY